MTILRKVLQWVERNPERVAYISGERSLTYGELGNGIKKVAAYIEKEIPKDRRSPIIIRGHKEPEMLIGFLGAIGAGHPYIPVDAAASEEGLQNIITVSGAALVLTPPLIAEVLADMTTTDISSFHELGKSDPFYIMFTSGSTGNPKGVIITEQNLESFVDWIIAEQELSPGREVFLDQAPFSFDLSVMDIYPALCTGNTLFNLRAEDIENPARMYRLFPASGLTIWVSTPSFVRLCLFEKTFGQSMLPRLRKMLFCGETLSPHLVTKLFELFPSVEIWNMYGPTEATVATTSVRIDASMLAYSAPLPVGYPRPASSISIRKEDGASVPPGTRGEIMISGPHVSPGYLERSPARREKFFMHEGLPSYRTGDSGYIRDGLLFFTGRLDNQIKLHGHRIELEDIESQLQTLPGIQSAVVIAKMKDGVAEALVACIIPASEKVSFHDVERMARARLQEHLPVYMVPRAFHFLKKFPLTANGKIDRDALAEKYHV